MDEYLVRMEADPHHKDNWQEAGGSWQRSQTAKRHARRAKRFRQLAAGGGLKNS
jgi:hypothetical protein